MSSRNPFAPNVPFSYPRCDAGVTLTENTSLKITHPTGQYNARMGTSVALSGDASKLIVGMPEGANYEDETFETTASGRVQAYIKKPDGTWSLPSAVPIVSISWPDSETTENVGTNVAISRNGYFVSSSELLSNRVSVISGLDNTEWTIQCDNIPGPMALNANGSRIVIGMPLGGPSTHQGRVSVYGLRPAWPGGMYGDSYLIGNSLTGANNNDNLGSEVCINDEGNIIGVGIPGADLAGSNLGAVKIYKLMGSTWTQIGQTIGLYSEEKVTKLSMNAAGDIIAIGAGLNQGGYGSPVGDVSVYKFDGTHWNLLGHKIINILNEYVQIGHAVALSADGYTLVASNGESTVSSGTFNEAVSVYRYNGFDWIRIGSFLGSSNTAQHGYSVAISSDGKTIVAGAPGTNSNRGEVRYFTLNV